MTSQARGRTPEPTQKYGVTATTPQLDSMAIIPNEGGAHNGDDIAEAQKLANPNANTDAAPLTHSRPKFFGSQHLTDATEHDAHTSRLRTTM